MSGADELARKFAFLPVKLVSLCLLSELSQCRKYFHADVRNGHHLPVLKSLAEGKSQIKLALASSLAYEAEVSLFASNVNPPQCADLDGLVTDAMQFSIHGAAAAICGSMGREFKDSKQLPPFPHTRRRYQCQNSQRGFDFAEGGERKAPRQ